MTLRDDPVDPGAVDGAVSLPDEEAANANSYPLLVLVLQDLLQKS